ncbi:vomeronasal type-2 receptor 116-like isoform X3 [Arvicanthis niloticus]|uniref:vomeronasal type-2 receptor 116-like isoform X4 n=1 Tax=Arvicanthis niloticus TaxID=61156 RepID=UPI0014869786|nr:vomeronasal type-2 receptor 116-like isoform X4 [Arvicanthis niloticus]
MKKLRGFTISFLLLKFSLILCCLTELSCFWRIKNSEDNDGHLRSDCGFGLMLSEEAIEDDFYNQLIPFRIQKRKSEFLLVMIFAAEEINKNPYLLPNMSLYFDIIVGLCEDTLGILDEVYSQQNHSLEFINYICGLDPTCAAGIIGPSWKSSLRLALYSRTPTVFFGPFNPNLSDPDQLPFVYQVAMKDTHLCYGMVSLMVNFRWTWLGLVISDNDQGIQFLSDMREEMQRHGICLAFVNVIPENTHLYVTRAKVYDEQITISTARVIIIYGDMNSTLEISFRRWEYLGAQRIWITTSQWDVITNKKDFTPDFFHGTVTFAHHKAETAKLRNFMQTINTYKYPVSISDSVLGWNYFNFSISKESNKTDPFTFINTLEWTTLHKYDMVLSNEGYNLYNAIYAVAYTYQELILQQIESQKMAEPKGLFMDCLQVPSSRCSLPCTAGFRKIHQKETADCCFDCVQCPENEVSNETDMEQCVRCSDDKYANLEQTHCLQRAVSFLAYEDPVGMALACMALCFSAVTILVLVIFVKHKDTPIVKANNCTLSYILLISLIFCFLCSLLFIGHPNQAICILQQTTFGVFFTVAVSTVLAKTITVVLAFKLTTPGRRMRGIITAAPKLVIPICTLIQLVLCGTWLVTSPPFIDRDIQSEHGKTVIICNKGSVIAFHFVLGYLGFLALGTFTVSFLARNLPDRFNEAKFLTFSMLVFCSVWITFLPVYHSTMGKVLLVVEVFSILASSAGLLGCIFIPKCYAILLRQDLNSLQKYKDKFHH